MGKKKELYEVAKDIGQNSDVYERYPEIAKRLEDDFAGIVPRVQKEKGVLLTYYHRK